MFDAYKTVGPDNTFHIKNEVPERPESVCYIITPESCTSEQFEAVANGTAIIKDYVFIGYAEESHEVMKPMGESNAQKFLGKEDL